MNALTFAGPDRRESERRAAASATEFARGQKFGRLESADEIARLTASVHALAAAARLYIAWTDAEDDHSKADFYERIGMCAAAEKATRAALASIKQGGAK